MQTFVQLCQISSLYGITLAQDRLLPGRGRVVIYSWLCLSLPVLRCLPSAACFRPDVVQPIIMPGPSPH